MFCNTFCELMLHAETLYCLMFHAIPSEMLACKGFREIYNKFSTTAHATKLKYYYPHSVHNLHYCAECNEAIAPSVKGFFSLHECILLNVYCIIFQLRYELFYYKFHVF